MKVGPFQRPYVHTRQVTNMTDQLMFKYVFDVYICVQEDAIKLILAGHHVVLNIPTGGGKSLPQMAANIFARGEQILIPTQFSTEDYK